MQYEAEEVRRTLRSQWLSSMHEFADLPTQRRRWLNLPGNTECSSYVELMCGYFDDLVFVDGLTKIVASGLITQSEADAVGRFHKVIDDFKPRDSDHRALLDDPKWHEVVAAAQEARAVLLLIVEDPAEVDILNNG